MTGVGALGMTMGAQTFQKVHKKRLKFGSIGNNTYLCQQKVETEIEY
jgi:hypothetical protein